MNKKLEEHDKKKTYTISLDQDLKKEMEQVASMMGMTLSEWIRFIAKDKIGYFKRNREYYFYKEKHRIKRHKEEMQKRVSERNSFYTEPRDPDDYPSEIIDND